MWRSEGPRAGTLSRDRQAERFARPQQLVGHVKQEVAHGVRVPVHQGDPELRPYAGLADPVQRARLGQQGRLEPEDRPAVYGEHELARIVRRVDPGQQHERRNIFVEVGRNDRGFPLHARRRVVRPDQEGALCLGKR
jgi:hypothetical protein